MLVRVALLVLATASGLAAAEVADSAPGFSLLPPSAGGLELLLAAGWTVALAGLAHQWSNPDRWRTGVLLVLVGVAWFAAELDSPAAPSVLLSAGLLLFAAWPAVLLHAALAYPSGRLARWPDRTVVGCGYVATVGVQGLAVALVFDPVTAGCTGCARNLWSLGDDPLLVARWGEWGVRAGAGWLVAALLLLGWRLWHAGRARTRVSGGVWVAALATLLLVAASYARGLERGLLRTQEVDRQLWVAQAVGLAALAAAALLGLVRERRSRRDLTAVVVGMAGSDHAGSLRSALVKGLGDPDLVLAYPVEGGDRLVDPEGNDVPGSDGPALELRYRGSHLATVLQGSGAPHGTDLVGDLVETLHLRLENERLRAEALAQAADLQASAARIVAAADAERRTLERNLHDGAQQRLVGLALGLRLQADRSPAGSLSEAQRELAGAIEALRTLGRGLHPVVLDDAGLATAVRALAETRPVTAVRLAEGRFPAVVESTAYLLVERATSGGAAEVAIEHGDGGSLSVRVAVRGRLPGLDDVVDRVTTLGGTATTSGDRREIVVRLPMPPGRGPTEPTIR
jgi:signal transduction histidine kinase